MSARTLVSIVIPIYNVETYLRECLDSIFVQTYKNIEIILVDDGSTDTSGEICEEYSQKDNRIKVYHKENGGLSDARNYGIEKATGEYLTFVDSDDRITEDYVEKLVVVADKYQVQMVIASFSELTSVALTPSNTVDYFEEELSVEDYLSYLYSSPTVQEVTFTTAWAKLYHRDLFQTIRFPFGKQHEDEFTTYKLAIEAGKIVYINTFLYDYRQREGSIMQESYNLGRLDAIEALEERVRCLQEREYDTSSTKISVLYQYWFNCTQLKKYGFNIEYQIYHRRYHKVFKSYLSSLPLKEKIKAGIRYYFPRLAWKLTVLKNKG